MTAATIDTGLERIAAAFAGAAGAAALMPYLMGGFPTLEASVRIGEAYAEAVLPLQVLLFSAGAASTLPATATGTVTSTRSRTEVS